MWQGEIEILISSVLGESMASAEALFSRNLSSSSPKTRKNSGLPNGEEKTRSQPPPPSISGATIMEDVKQVSGPSLLFVTTY